MKIGILSDLHVDLNREKGQDVITPLYKVIKDKSVDMFLISGDVSNNCNDTVEILKSLEKDSGARIVFVPGNHDIWNKNCSELNAWQAYEILKKFPGNICDNPCKINNDWVIIGDIGWYDYSFGDKDISTEEFDRMSAYGRTWQDSIYAVWGKSTLETHQYFYNKLKSQLQEYKDKNIIMLTHAVPHADFTVQNPNEMWKYFNAFLGSKQYGELALEYEIKYAVIGHVHYRMEKTIEGTRFICSNLGYVSEWDNKEDALDEISRTIRVIEI